MLSDGGGYPDDAATLFVEAARKAGVPACVPVDKLLVAAEPHSHQGVRCRRERTKPPASPAYFRLGKLNSAPLRMPAGQRAVTVLRRV